MRKLLLLVCLAAVPSLGAPDHAAAADGCPTVPNTNFFVAGTDTVGVVDVYFFGAMGVPVHYYECVGGRLVSLGTRQTTENRNVLSVPWLCDRVERTFLGFAVLPGGTKGTGMYSIRTGSCASRFEVRVPRRARPGATVPIQVTDRWGTGGIAPKLCVTPPGGERACTAVKFADAIGAATRSFKASAKGRWKVELRIQGHAVRRSVAVGSDVRLAPAPPVILATGDSTMQGVDSFLADELGNRARVRSDTRPGSGLSKDDDWLRYARGQVKRSKPATTVMSIGAADGFPFSGDGASLTCCGEPWVAEYGRRARQLMRVYARGGRSRVVWLTLPTPRDPKRRPIAAAVNAGILRAAQGLRTVRVLRIDAFFSPDGYRETLAYRGRDVPVRNPDGIHLNVAGTAISARLLADVVRTWRSAP